ncbi:hypothetical protein NEIELOOT_00951 [Neisseria elongata subsp. glycolytica ATCC 29315]|uniref:Uncharacterized protein n=1 Tax=Neisseria elongata subsp. glycolytica ATCC 29315 TaxID=546263 RepID=D4DPG4_NEIEG|nr:hypothetical protein NEIELOOT_00951 [Neisseria elongata subsp. glycolytica ATCC 29315]
MFFRRPQTRKRKMIPPLPASDCLSLNYRADGLPPEIKKC